MAATVTEKVLDELTMVRACPGRARDRESLAKSSRGRARAVHGIAHIFSETGSLLADATTPPALYAYLDGFVAGRDAVAAGFPGESLSPPRTSSRWIV